LAKVRSVFRLFTLTNALVKKSLAERTPGNGFGTMETAILCRSALADDACGIEVLLE
jgi:hypothetical protein